MSADSEDQKEILLGNKQLLSIFFIVVVLLGVSFTIGYIIGKNTAAMHSSATVTDRQSSARVEPRDTPTLPSANQDPAPDKVTPARKETPPETVPKAAPTTHAAKPYQGQPPAGNPDPEPAQTDPDATTPAADGSYLQVAALKREDADRIAKMLRNRGYPARLGDSSKEGLFRVLVGPFKSMTDLADSKQKLKASGMDSFIVR
jgi:cell division septation protein DedD